MPAYQVQVSHGLGAAAARARLESFLEQVRRDYAAQLSEMNGAWTADCLSFEFRAAGMPMSGTLLVQETHVHVSGQLPLAAAFFRGRIEQTIRDELRKLLS